MSQIITRVSKLDNNSATKILKDIDNSLVVLKKEEILKFLEENNTLINKCLPVNADKMVVSGRASTTAARMELGGIKTILNNPGTLQRFKGLNDDERTTDAVKASGFAIQHRYSSIGIDLDCEVFGGDLPEELVEWIAVHHPYSLKVRGNRKRLTLIFGITEDLQDYLRTFGRHKLNYTLSKRTLEKVEIQFGNVNNTVYGYHPSAKNYQQILPDSGTLGDLSLESFKELKEILDSISYKVEKKHTTAGGGRMLLEDADTELAVLTNDLNNYLNMRDKMNLDVELELSLKEFLNPETIAIIKGTKYFDGSSYIDVDEDADFSIGTGGRFYSYFSVGSDVNAIAYIFDKCEIEFDKNEIDEIIDEMWERTDSVGNGSKADKYTQNEALAAFNATATYPTIKSEYLSVIIKRLRVELNERVNVAINNKKSESKNSKKSREIVEDEVVSDAETQDEEVINDASDDDFDFGECLDETTQKFEEKSKEIDQEKKKDSNKEISPIDNDVMVGTKETYNQIDDARLRAKSDDWEIFNPTLKAVLEHSVDTDVDGYSYAIMTQTLSLLAGVGGYVDIKNNEYAPHKPEESLNPYKTPFIPFAAVVGDSGIGKSQVRESFHLPTISLINSFAKLDVKDKKAFERRFASPKNNKKFKEDKIDPATNEPVDPWLGTVQGIVEYDAKTDIFGMTSLRANCVTDDATDAGYRDNLVAQEAQVGIKIATEGQHFQNAYYHPINLYSDELNSVMKKLFDGTITYGGSPEFFMMRKAAGSMRVARGGYNYDFDRAGLSIAGNLITNKVHEYISKELVQGTDGVTPRFNFAYIEREENKDYSNYKFGKNRKEEARVDMAGIMMTARFASIHADTLVNCPYGDNTLNFSSDAQKEYGIFLEQTKKTKEKLITKFGHCKSYISSLFGKASAELAIYAGGVNLLNQLTNLWNDTKKILPSIDAMSKLLESKNLVNKQKLGEQINNSLTLSALTFKWSLNISGEEIKTAAKIMNHHYDFIEMVLENLQTNEINDSTKRSKAATQEKIITAVEGDSYVSETHVKKIAEGVSTTLQCLGADKEFAISDLQRKIYTVRKLNETNNGQRVVQIMDLLCDLGILEKTSYTAKGYQRYRLLCSIVQLNERIPKVVAAFSKQYRS